MLKNFNNKTEKAGDELKKDIKAGSRVNVAAAIFSIYGYEALKSELKNIKELRFIFTDPTFVEMDKANREQRLFEIHANDRKKAISGSDFEINLKMNLRGERLLKSAKNGLRKKSPSRPIPVSGTFNPNSLLIMIVKKYCSTV